MQLSFSFLESNAILTDLSLFTVTTTGETKHLRLRALLFPSVRFLLVFLTLSRLLLVGVVELVLISVSPDSVPVLAEYLFRCLLLWCCVIFEEIREFLDYSSLFRFFIICRSDVSNYQVEFLHPVHSE